MKVSYDSARLPVEVGAALVPGERETVILLNRRASVEDIAEALDELVGQEWVRREWLHVGDVGKGLRSVG